MDKNFFKNSYLKALGSVSKQTGAEGVLTLEKLQLKGKIYDGAHKPSMLRQVGNRSLTTLDCRK